MHMKNSLLMAILIRFRTLIEIILEPVSKKIQGKNYLRLTFFFLKTTLMIYWIKLKIISVVH